MKLTIGTILRIRSLDRKSRTGLTGLQFKVTKIGRRHFYGRYCKMGKYECDLKFRISDWQQVENDDGIRQKYRLFKDVKSLLKIGVLE